MGWWWRRLWKQSSGFAFESLNTGEDTSFGFLGFIGLIIPRKTGPWHRIREIADLSIFPVRLGLKNFLLALLRPPKNLLQLDLAVAGVRSQQKKWYTQNTPPSLLLIFLVLKAHPNRWCTQTKLFLMRMDDSSFARHADIPSGIEDGNEPFGEPTQYRFRRYL